MVWKKKADGSKQSAEHNCKELFEHTDRLKADENKKYRDIDLEEYGGSDKVINQDSIAGMQTS